MKGNGKRFFHLLLICIIMLASFQMVDSVQAETGATYDARYISFAPGNDESEANFSWYAKTTSDPGVVQYAKVDNGFSGDFPVDKATEVQAKVSKASLGNVSHKATITNLEPSSSYVYRLGDGKGNWSDSYTFKTHASDAYNFVLVGDPQIGSGNVKSDSEGWAGTLNKAISAHPNTSFILSAGDQVNKSTSETEYEGYFSPNIMRNIPVATTIGNHDTSEYYRFHFNAPNESKYGETSAGGNYHFTYGDTLFMVLNSNNSNTNEHSQYMENIVNDNPDAKWRIVVFHHSIYSAANHSLSSSIINLRNGLVPTIDKLDIDVVLAGHDHSYVRTYQMLADKPLKNQTVDDKGRVVNPEGTLFLTANSSSGSKYYTLKPDHEYYAAVREQLRVPTFTNISVTPTTIRLDTYRTDTMKIVDTYEILKDSSVQVEKPELASISLEANSKVLPTAPTNSYEDVQLEVKGKDTKGNDYFLKQSDITYKTSNDQLIAISETGKVTVKAGATPNKVKVWAEVTLQDEMIKSNEIELEIIEHEEMTIFSKGATWKYLDDGSDQGTAWRAADFDDSSWKEGAAPLGYGAKETRPYFGTVKTVIGYGPDSKNKYATSYFRTSFDLEDVSNIGDSGIVNFGIDDSLILYLNGIEIGRFNLPEGEIGYDKYLIDFDGYSWLDEDRYETLNLSKEHLSLLKEGKNVLAAEVHQDRPSSSDVYWDMELLVTKESNSLAQEQ